MPASYTGNPAATQAPSPAPGPGVAPVVSIPTVGDGGDITSITQDIKVLADFSAYATTNVGGGVFGDGSDGTLSFDGSTTILGMAPVSNVYTLVRDIFASNLTLTGPTISIATNGFRIYVKNTLTTNGGKLTANGLNSGGVTAGAATNANGVTGYGSAGGNGGGSGSGFGAIPPFTYGFGAVGGNGGLGAAGAGGTSTGPAAVPAGWGSPRAYSPATLGLIAGYLAASTVAVSYAFMQPIFGGTGGAGGGAGGAAQNGGGGGGGAGVLCVAARIVVLTNANDFQAIGGGGSGAIGTNAGGGGGGGGGVVLVAYAAISGATLVAATSCVGGNGGSKTGTGVNGSTGSTGVLFLMQVV